MIYERLILMRDLLAEDGSIYVHCDWRVNAYIRLRYGRSLWSRQFRERDYLETNDCSKRLAKQFGRNHDTIFLYSKSTSTFSTRNSSDIAKNYIESHSQHDDEHGRRIN